MSMILRRLMTGLVAVAVSLSVAATSPPSKTDTVVADSYSMADFAHVRKYDAHVHANNADMAFLEQARADGFELLSINVDYPDFPSLERQHAIALTLAAKDPRHFHWATTFSMKGFGTPGWTERVDASLARDVAKGALAVKIWKNVGLVEKNADGKLIMLDDPGLAPVAEQVRALGVALIDHQGEPRNCWLPLDQMTTDNDREYFSKHPEYYMYLHPEQPGYEELMRERDRFVAAHPKLRFVGAHLASLEYDVDRIAAFLDRFPNATVDMAARMSQVQYQSVRDREKVRNFFIRYQDRVLYGTDLTFAADAKPAEFRREAHAVWSSDWRYLATGESQRVDMIHADVPGLALPRAVVDKIYYANAVRVFAAPRPVD
ncbi:amidohydrolase [Rhodanobacter sp. Soil772]|uniref:amidohydrolase family protein n=1 Tax=Rhodanobacter sp. Soil772 TaxID=1736406 RepID=UPI0006FA99B6|nr:amidohydrolase family protein [Rhodanobacter sp. Soil772]KRE85617.1 amidohydrolase [Rhodanobacter sp. Soil772]